MIAVNSAICTMARIFSCCPADEPPSLAANAGETGSFMFCESFLFKTVTKCKIGAPVTIAIIPQIRLFVNL